MAEARPKEKFVLFVNILDLKATHYMKRREWLAQYVFSALASEYLRVIAKICFKEHDENTVFLESSACYWDICADEAFLTYVCENPHHKNYISSIFIK